MKVLRASEQTQTRQGEGHLGMLSHPQNSLNKVAELAERWLRGLGVEQMPLLTRHVCVSTYVVLTLCFSVM